MNTSLTHALATYHSTGAARPMPARSRRYGILAGFLLALLVLTACDDQTPQPTAAPTVEPQPVQSAQTASESSIAAQQPPPAVEEEGSSGTPEEPIADEAQAEPNGQLVLWHSWAGADADALAAILADFNALHPEITVETLFVGYNDLLQAYADAVAAGGGPDLLFTPNWWLGDLVAADAAQTLDAMVSADEIAAYLPAAIDNLRWDGHLYALPITVETIGLYVNNALLPPGGVPQTTDEWLALVQNDASAGAGIYTNLYHLFWGIPAYGGLFMDEQGVMIMEQTGGVAQFLTWLRAMFQTDGNFIAQDYGALLDRFKKGEFPFFIDGPWAAPDLRQALGDGLTVARLPDGPAGPAQPWLSADGVVINPVSPPAQQELALLLARQLSGPTGGAQWASVAGRIPAHRAAEMGADPLLAGFAAQAATALPMPARPEMDEVWGYAGDMLIKVLGEVLTPEDAVIEASALINEANGK